MKKILLGILIGIIGTIAYRNISSAYRVKRFLASPEASLPTAVEISIEHDLPGATFHDMSWSTSTSTVNYAHSVLYDVNVTYEREGQIKRFTAVYGMSDRSPSWICPRRSDLEILDDEAEILHKRKEMPNTNLNPISGSSIKLPEKG